MTQQQAIALQQQIRRHWPDCIVVARRMIDWNNSEWWFVQVEYPQRHVITVIADEREWLKLSQVVLDTRST